MVPISFSDHQGLGGVVVIGFRADNQKVAGSIPVNSTKPTLETLCLWINMLA